MQDDDIRDKVHMVVGRIRELQRAVRNKPTAVERMELVSKLETVYGYKKLKFQPNSRVNRSYNFSVQNDFKRKTLFDFSPQKNER